jgi:hypothetical protein
VSCETPVVESFPAWNTLPSSTVGEMPPWGNGPLQSKIYEGAHATMSNFLTDLRLENIQRSKQGIDKAYEQDASLPRRCKLVCSGVVVSF